MLRASSETYIYTSSQVSTFRLILNIYIKSYWNEQEKILWWDDATDIDIENDVDGEHTKSKENGNTTVIQQ
jgi:hypothetical protein